MEICEADGATEFASCGLHWSIDRNASPLFRITDSGAEALATFDNGEVAVGRIGKRIFASLPYLPKELMRKILSDAGAHLYSDSGDPVIAASGCVMINCQGAGERTLTFKSGESINIKVDDHETMVFDEITKQRIL